MKNINLAIFLSLNGQASEAISFYQTVLNGKLLFKITNQEFQERLNPDLILPKGQEKFVSHSIVQVGDVELQIADNPVYEGMKFTQGNMISFSVLTSNIEEAKEIFNQVMQHPEAKVLSEPSENEFANFYAIVQDPFGVVIQITKEKHPDPETKGIS